MIKEIYEQLLQYYAQALRCLSIKGYPTWQRQTAQLPCLALELFRCELARSRIGQRFTVGQIIMRGWIFARNEAELCELVEEFINLHKAGMLDLTPQPRECNLLQLERLLAPAQATEYEQHVFAFLLAIT